jgi:molecular chaperone IbpA
MAIHRISFEPFAQRTVGFDRILNNLESIMNVTQPMNLEKYPPHNIILIDETRYIIELALAGFKQEDIDIVVDSDMLVVKADSKEATPNYLYRGIGARAFTKTFKLADTVVVSGASFENGILRIQLENVVPESRRPRKIEIGKPVLLNE